VKGLRVELAGEGLDLLFIKGINATGEALSDVQIFEIKGPDSLWRDRIGHDTRSR